MSNASSFLPLSAPDLVCLDDLDPFASETTSDLQSLAQDVYHDLGGPPGNNPDDLEQGFGILQLLSAPEDVVAGFTSLIEQKLERDDRVQTCKATLTKLGPGQSFPDGTTVPAGGVGYLLEIQIVPSPSVMVSAPGTVNLAYALTGTGGLVPL